MGSPASTSAQPSSSEGIYGLADAAVGPGAQPAAGPETTIPADGPETTVAQSPPAGAPDARAAGPGAEAEGGDGAGAPAAKPKVKRVVRRVRRWDAPAWVVSAIVHLGILVALGLITFREEIRTTIQNLNSSLVPLKKPGGEEEMTPIYADPSNAPRDQAVGNTDATTPGGGGGLGSGVGTGPPSATPVVGGRGSGTARAGAGSALPNVKVVAPVSGLAMLPAAPGRDLGGGGMIAGDVTFDSEGIGPALDQISREILRHLQQHKVTVLWLFDESESMKDDQKTIREKFSRVVTELRVNVDPRRKDQPLTHAVVGFGGDVHLELEKPTAGIDVIGRAIDHLRVEPSGVENTMTAVRRAIEHYGGLVRKDHKLLIVMVTDESGDDGGYVEEARQAAVSKGVPIYIIGRQSLFGYPFARLLYIDPVTKDHYWPLIRRGPETPDLETLQWDGLHDRWDEQPSGFAPYELARLAKDTGGIYFLLPSEENMRIRQREKAYSIATLKEYVPSYESRVVYNEKRARSDLRRTLYEVIVLTKGFPYRKHFSVLPPEMIQQATAEFPKVTERLNILIQIEARLKALKKARDREPEKRWQAHYDLMLGQVVAHQIIAYEYRALLKAMVASPPTPGRMPSPEMTVVWDVNHSQKPLAPKGETEKVYAEATRLLKAVIADHPRTPWADLAQDELTRGFSVKRDEWRHSPQYAERAKFVPKY